MAGKSKSQNKKTRKIASQNRGLLTEEDRSLWQRVVDSLEMKRAKNERGRTKHSVTPMALSDEVYAKPQVQNSTTENSSEIARQSAHNQTNRSGKDKNKHDKHPKATNSAVPLNNIDKKDDLGLWDNFKSTLDHQKPQQKAPIKPAKPAPKLAAAYTIPSAPAQVAQPPSKRPAHNGLQHHPLEDRIAKKLAKKKISIDARIDLHGMTQDQAHRALEGFLINAQKNALSIVLVITGKGAQGQGVLRHVVPQWLHSEPFAHMTNGFRHANAQHGGTGALYVRIRKQRNGR